jgi:hypothetical protein
VTNVFGFEQVFGYRAFDRDGIPLPNYLFNQPADAVVQVAQVPPAPRAFFVGMFVSFRHADGKVDTRPPSRRSASGEDDAP